MQSTSGQAPSATAKQKNASLHPALPVPGALLTLQPRLTRERFRVRRWCPTHTLPNSALHREALKPISMLCHTGGATATGFAQLVKTLRSCGHPWGGRPSETCSEPRGAREQRATAHAAERPFPKGLCVHPLGLHRRLSAPSMITIYKALIAPASECPHR